MQKLKRVALLMVLATGGGTGTTALAEDFAPMGSSEYTTLSAAFEGGLPADASLLDNRAMEQTHGQLWPLVGGIAAIVGVDLALAGYFWGVYVPSMGGGSCATCTIPTPSHR
ncbi:MAG: hypothetical protein AAGG55_07205 [Pseudomonadota bacterium]